MIHLIGKVLGQSAHQNILGEDRVRVTVTSRSWPFNMLLDLKPHQAFAYKIGRRVQVDVQLLPLPKRRKGAKRS